MPDIRIGDQIGTEWWPAAVENDEATDQLNITSLTFIPGTPEVGVNFITPRTGRIGICVAGNWVQSQAGNRVFISYEVYEGTSAAGVLKRSARAHLGISDHGSTLGGAEQGHGAMQMVEALTPEVAHYARIVYMTETAGGTSDITHRRIIVFPLP